MILSLRCFGSLDSLVFTVKAALALKVAELLTIISTAPLHQEDFGTLVSVVLS